MLAQLLLAHHSPAAMLKILQCTMAKYSKSTGQRKRKAISNALAPIKSKRRDVRLFTVPLSQHLNYGEGTASPSRAVTALSHAAAPPHVAMHSIANLSNQQEIGKIISINSSNYEEESIKKMKYKASALLSL